MKKLLNPKSNSGLTLVEVLMASAIFVVLAALLYGVYFSGLDIWETARFQADLQAQARLALNFMVSELRNATRTSTQNPSPNLSIPSTPNNKQIHFYLPEDKDKNGLITDANGSIEWATNNQIDYQFIPGQHLLRRLEKGEKKILAEDVADLQFIDIGIDPTLAVNELKIILTLNTTTPRQRMISVTLSAVVALRN